MDVDARNKVLILIAQLIAVCLPSELVVCQHIIFSFLLLLFFFFLRSLHEAYKINSQRGGRVYMCSAILKVRFAAKGFADLIK